MTKESFLRGAVILAAASTLSRLVGIAYIIVLPRLISDQGMGLFQLVKPLHYLAAVLAIGGMPVAVSKLIAEKAAQGRVQGLKQVFRSAVTIMSCTGLGVALSLILGARFFAAAFARDLTLQPIIAILGPACFFLALSAAWRGFFQGLQYMTPTAVSQVVDQLVRVSVSLYLGLRLRPRGIEFAVSGLAWGSVLGEFVGWLVLVAYYLGRKRALLDKIKKSSADTPEHPWDLFRNLFSLAVPVVVVTILWPIMQLADSVLIPVRMEFAGYSPDAVRQGLGHLGMALAISQLPNIITVALSTSLIPAVSEAWALGNKKMVRRRAGKALRIVLIFGLPAFTFLYFLAQPLALVLFGYPQVGAPLRILAAGSVTLGLIQAATGILQGLGKMNIPVRNLFLGVVLKFSLNYILVARPAWGVLGAAWSTVAAWTVVALLNLAAVWRRIGLMLPLSKGVLKPLFSAFATAIFSYYLQDTLARWWPLAAAAFFSGALGLSLYFLLLVMGGSLQKKDLDSIPLVGPCLGSFLQTWGFLHS